ncbi:hypothetical protein FRC18_011387, partial [Serendipita sp. 400]
VTKNQKERGEQNRSFNKLPKLPETHSTDTTGQRWRGERGNTNYRLQDRLE